MQVEGGLDEVAEDRGLHPAAGEAFQARGGGVRHVDGRRRRGHFVQRRGQIFLRQVAFQPKRLALPQRRVPVLLNFPRFLRQIPLFFQLLGVLVEADAFPQREERDDELFAIDGVLDASGQRRGRRIERH